MIGAISSHGFPITPYSTPTAAEHGNETQATQAAVAHSDEERANRTAETEQSKQGEQQQQNEQQAQQEQQQLDQLQKRDREVRAHEAAHQAAAGALGGAAHYELKTGPDGKRYAVGGEVSIDISKVAGDPQATLAKANRVKSAALAPVDPSAQDRAVAAQASVLASEALKEINTQRTETEDANSGQDNSVGTTQIQTESQGSNREAAAAARNDSSASGDNEEQTAKQEAQNRNAVSAYQNIQSSSDNAALHLIA